MVEEIRPEIELSIIMPCLNEAATLASCIAKAQRTLAAHHLRGEVIVADNGSTDGSVEIARRMGARLVNAEAKGYGSAIMAGIRAASGKFLVVGDADDSYDFGGIWSFVEKLREGSDLVMGNRFRGGIEPGAMPVLHRYFGNPVLSGIGRLMFGNPCGDFHCGLRGLRREAALRMNARTTGMEFASEMVVKASLLGMKITEVPTTLSPDGRGRPPHLRRWRDGWRHLRVLLLCCPRWAFFYPGVALFLAGLIAGSFILPAPRELFGVTFDVHTLVYCAAAVLLGFQAIAFAVFAKIFSIQEGLLPPDPRLERFVASASIEWGLAAGAGLFVAGLAGSLWALGAWGARSFAELEPRLMLRIVIPASLAMTLGLQIVFASFFLGVLGLGRPSGRDR